MVDDLVAYAQIAPWPFQPDIVFWSALLLILGGSLGELVFRQAGLPRIVGYSAVGVVIALAGHGGGAHYLNGVVRIIVDLALGLLLFKLGSRVSLRWLRTTRGCCAPGWPRRSSVFLQC